jgi:hypothetical protein
MADSTGYILAAAAIAGANEAIFAPMATGQPLWKNFNWRIIPVTGVAVITLAGMEQLSEPLAKWLAILGLLTVLVVPVGNAQSPIENAVKAFKLG